MSRGRPKTLSRVDGLIIRTRYWLGANTAVLADKYGVSRGTVYRVIRKDY